MSIMQHMGSRDEELATSLGRLAYSPTDKFDRYFLHGVLRLKDSSAKKVRRNHLYQYMWQKQLLACLCKMLLYIRLKCFMTRIMSLF